MFCKNCGYDLGEGKRFCPKCGQLVTQPDLEKTSALISNGSVDKTQSITTSDIERTHRLVQPDKTVSDNKINNEIVQANNEISTIWPDWQVVEKIGEGSFGAVYKAQRVEINSVFYSAIKVIKIPKNVAESGAVRAEFNLDQKSTTAYYQGFVDECVNEIKLMESFKGTPNIVSVEDYKVIPNTNCIGWTIYIRMELLESFVDYSKDKQLSQEEIIKLGIDMCSALELCAQLNVMHRDIKPENIFISNFGIFKLGDFGIARQLEKATSVMSKKGTYNYMAPEIYQGKMYDFSADIYSLGIVLYKLLNNNRLPFVDPNSPTVTYQQIQQAFEKRMSGVTMPNPCNATNDLSAVILTACSYNPQNRFMDATAFKEALTNVLNGNGFVDSSNSAVDSHYIDGYNKQNFGSDNINVGMVNDGANIQNNVPPVKKQKKKVPKWKIVLIAVLSVVIVGGAVAGVCVASWYSSSDQKIIRALENGDYDNALEMYQDNGKETEELISLLKSKIESTKNDFKAGNVDYATAQRELQTIANMGIKALETDTKDAISFVDNLNASQTAFATAESYLASGDYERAIEQYKLVIEDDSNYEKAQNQLNTAIDKLRENAIKKAGEFADKQQYSQAITEINNALKVIPNDSQLTEKLNVYTSKNADQKSQNTLSEAKKYADDKDYENALKTIMKESNYQSDANLNSAFSEYESKYVENLKDTVNKNLESDYSSALSAVKAAKTLLPNNNDIKSLYEDVIAAEPVKLSSIKVSNSNDFEQITETSVEDSLGNLYSPGNLFKANCWSDRVGYGEFFMGSKYKKLTGTIATADDSKDIDCRIEIYVGNNTKDMTMKESYTLSRTTKPQNVDVDITGYEWIKIQLVSVENRYDTGSVLLSDFYVK
jgi:serine/threonine protein kinase